MLANARAVGFLGPGPVEPQLLHADGFAQVAEAALGGEPREFVDLGTGGGVPGLVLAIRWPAAGAVLVEANGRRAEGLRAAISRLDLGGRVKVLETRAEAAAQLPGYRERFALATARGFAGPAATAEIAAGFVSVDGALVVSEPPVPEEGRWPEAGLDRLGFGPARPEQAPGGRFVVIPKVAPAPAGVPRATGRPTKRPLW